MMKGKSEDIITITIQGGHVHQQLKDRRWKCNQEAIIDESKDHHHHQELTVETTKVIDFINPHVIFPDQCQTHHQVGHTLGNQRVINSQITPHLNPHPTIMMELMEGEAVVKTCHHLHLG